MGCCVCFGPKWLQKSLSARIGYEPLPKGGMENSVTVVVGKEQREFVVEQFVLEKGPFRVLLEMVRRDRKREEEEERVIFVGVDSILFEHMLWLMYNDCSSFRQLDLEEIVEFYAQDFFVSPSF